MTTGRDDDLPDVDAVLRAALRHAPDRDALPPAAVRGAILAAARNAARPSHGRRYAWSGWAAAWAALARAPAAGAAVASLVLGTLVLLMWQGGPPAEQASRAAVIVAAAPPARQPASATEAVDDAAPSNAPVRRERSEPQPPAARAASATATAQRRALPPDSTMRSGRSEPPVPDALARQDGRTAGHAATGTGHPATDEHATAPLASVAAAPAGRAPAAVVPPVPGLAPASSGAPAQPPASVPATAPTSASAQADLAAARMADAAFADPLAPVLLAFAGGAAEARQAERHPAAKTAQSVAADSAAPDWLVALRDAAGGRWQRVDDPSAGAGTPLHGAGAASLGRLAVEADAVLWQPASLPDHAWRAAGLPAELLARVRAGLAALPADPPASASRP